MITVAPSRLGLGSRLELLELPFCKLDTGMDLCLVGERGVGKTALSRAFAEVLGYRTYTVFCFKERVWQTASQTWQADAEPSIPSIWACFGVSDGGVDRLGRVFGMRGAVPSRGRHLEPHRKPLPGPFGGCWRSRSSVGASN